MTWGFVTCGPNEALVISGEVTFEVEAVWISEMSNDQIAWLAERREF